MSAREVVFVYGTLMHGQANHRVLVELAATLLGAASTASPRALVDLGPYPALLRAEELRDAAATPVAGEIFLVASEALPRLDAFEGCPDLYTRERILLTHEGQEIEAWTYVFATAPPAHAKPVETGRYQGGGVVLATNARERSEEVLDKRR